MVQRPDDDARKQQALLAEQERERMAREQQQLRERQRHEQDMSLKQRERLGRDAQARYEGVEQPGKHPGNMPDRRLDPERGPDIAREDGRKRPDVQAGRDPHKSVPDLEDLTGNPGHVGINPNAPTGFSERIAPASKTADAERPDADEQAKHQALKTPSSTADVDDHDDPERR